MKEPKRDSRLDAMMNTINLEWVVDDLFATIHPNTFEEIQKSKSPEDMLGYHFTLGMSVRNLYGLWDSEHALTKWFVQEGVYHADDMSAIILEALWHRIKELPYNHTQIIQMCQKQWTTIEEFK